jgi:hypothetical protein
MPVDLPRKTKSCFVTETDFLTGMFHLLKYGPSNFLKIQNVPPCRLVLYVAVGKAGEQGVFGEFSIHAAMVHSTRGSTDVFTSLDSADKPAEHDRFRTRSRSV